MVKNHLKGNKFLLVVFMCLLCLFLYSCDNDDNNEDDALSDI